MHLVEIQHIEAGSPASDHLKDGGENFVSHPVDIFQGVVVFEQEKEHAADDDDGKRLSTSCIPMTSGFWSFIISMTELAL